MRSLTLLGPQRLTPTLPEAVDSVGIDLSPGQPPLATVTAGWQEREDEDADLVAALLGNTVNLRLYARVLDIFERDPELARAHRERGQRLRDIQTLYELRLGHAMDAVYELLRRTTEGWLIDGEVESALGAVRALDERVLALNAEVTGEFLAAWRPEERDAVAAHRADVARVLRDASGLAIAGGQVPTLLNRLNLLGIGDHVEELHVFAWSAGAMVVTDRVVVFRDDPPHGRPYSRVFEVGLGWCCREETGFIGAEPIAAARRDGTVEKLAPFKIEGAGIPREGNPVLAAGEPAGIVTSGTFSPSLELGIGMAYVRADLAKPGTEVEIDVRGKHRRARIASKPLYSKEK